MNTHITHFLVDLDGCVSDPFIPPNWALLTELRNLSEQAHTESVIPKLGICTGRPASYAEAVGQWLAIQVPILFESGAGLLNIQTQEVLWNPQLPENAQEVSLIARRFIAELAAKYPEIQPESSKHIDAGLISSNSDIIKYVLPKMRLFVAENCPQLEVHATDNSINTVWPEANKGEGIRWFSKHMHIPLNHIAFIGDTSGDVPAIELAGIGIAPANAKEQNKKSAQWVTKASTTAGVIEAWHQLIEHNSRIASQKTL